MPTRPPTLPEWATGADAETSEPPAPSKTTGWLDAIPPPSHWFNWLQNNVFRWLRFFRETVAWYTDMDDAIDELAVGDGCLLFEDDNSTGPGVELVEKATGLTGADTARSIDTCGDLVVLAIGDNDPIAVPRDLDGAESGGTPVASYTRSNAGLVTRVRTNGTVTVVAQAGGWVEGFNALTGALLWTHDNDAKDVFDLVISGSLAVFCHDTTTGGGDTVNDRELHAVNLTTGAVVWSYKHDAQTVCVAANGRQLFLGGSASGALSGSRIRALRLSDGADFDGETGATVDDDGLAWNQAPADTPSYQCLAADHRFVFVGYDNLDANQLECRGAGNGEDAWQMAHPDANMRAGNVAADQDYVLLTVDDNGATPEGFVEAYDKRTGSLVWRYAATDKAATHAACVAVTSDGSRVYCIAHLSTDDFVWQISRGNMPHAWHRVDPASVIGGIRNLKLQPEQF